MTSPDDLRICVISSGLDRFHRSCSERFKEQIGVATRPIDFYGLFWQPVTSPNAQDYLQGFRKGTFWTLPQRDFGEIPDVFRAPETKPKNLFSMAWGKYMLGEQLTNEGAWGKYDIFIYCRPDVCFDHEIDFALLAEQLQTADICFPTNGHWRGGWNDQVCFAGPNMKVYLDFFTEILPYMQKGVLLHPESMLKHYLVDQGLRIAQHPIQSFIYRDEKVFNLG